MMTAADEIATLKQLIMDMCTHAKTQNQNRYASLKDEHEVVDTLNERITDALAIAEEE